VEQSKKFDLPSGAKLTVTMAPFADSMELTKEVLRSVQGSKFAPEDMSRDFKSVYEAAVLVPAFLDKVIALATSDKSLEASFKCAKRALYVPKGSAEGFPGLPVNKDLFDDPEHALEAREDLAQILWAIAEVNCKPFLAKALSGLMGLFKQATSVPSSTTP
jgi:hypothetical protein